MTLYLDSSSLTKRYLNESGSTDVMGLVLSFDRVATSLVAYAETRAALARAFRGRRITDVEHGELVNQFDRDWQLIGGVALDDALAAKAGELAGLYFLRGLDAIHLASALLLQQRIGEPVTFSAFDDRLNEAAADSGLELPLAPQRASSPDGQRAG